MKKTKIEWCDSTVNPVFGCTYGCEYCYARNLNKRFQWIDDWKLPQFFPEKLKVLNTKKPYNIFMNSMSDIADWKKEWIEQVFKTIHENTQHNYLFLTKRPLIAGRFIHTEWLTNENVWFGATYTGENGKPLTELLEYGCDSNLYLSIEPLLEYPTMLSGARECRDFDRLKWIIIGAETGNRKDKVIPKKEWIDEIVKVAKENDIPVFMKDSLIPIVGRNDMLREFPLKLSKGH